MAAFVMMTDRARGRAFMERIDALDRARSREDSDEPTMSDWTVHLEFEEGTSSKFWRARVEGKTLYVNYGKIGSNGQTQVKDFGDPAAARRSTTSSSARSARRAT